MKTALFVSFVILLLSRSLWATPDFTSWSSERGVKRLERSEYKSDFFRIANVFQSESQDVFNAARASAILLSALEIEKPGLFEILSSRLEISAETSPPKLRDLRSALDEQTISTRLFIIAELDTTEKIREILIASLKNSEEMILINFAFKDSNENLIEVFAPLGAYEEESDSFLVMDLNPKRAPWKWLKAQSLFDFMSTSSGEENRGFVIIQSPLKSTKQNNITQE